MLKKAVRIGELSLVGTLLLSSIGEISLRHACGDKYGKRPCFYVADPVLGWKPASNLDHTFYGRDFKIQVRTDEDGHRLGALGKVDFSKQLILLSGNSHVFGWGVSTKETMSSRLDEYVATASSENTRAVNMGVGSYGTLQYFHCLERFLAKHEDARVVAVLVFHGSTDGTDNLNSIGFHMNMWKARDREPKPRCPLHLTNFVTCVLQMIRGRTDDPKTAEQRVGDIHPYLHDILFGYEFELPRKVPSQVMMNNTVVSFHGLSEEDYSSEITSQRQSYTRIQRDLILQGVNAIHLLLADRRTKIFHVLVPTTPDWAVKEFSALFARVVPSGDNEIVVMGRYPDDLKDFENDVFNKHSGQHFSPEFNSYWANKLVAIFREYDLGKVD